MLKFVLKRILMLIPVILGIVLIVFTIMYLTPGDPARLILGEKAPQEQVDVLRDQMGLNDPFVVQFARYVGNMLRGDLGRSYATNIPVAETIAERFPKTAELALAGMFLSVLIGMPIGILSAVKRYSILDNISMIFAMLATAIPAFWLGMMLIIAFSLNLKWFPSSGFDTFRQMVLPTITLAARQRRGHHPHDPVLHARGGPPGLHPHRVGQGRGPEAGGARPRAEKLDHPGHHRHRHQLRLPAGRRGGHRNGVRHPRLGTAMVNAIRMKDNPLVLGSVVYIAIVFSLVNLAVDIIYALIDPRLRE